MWHDCSNDLDCKHPFELVWDASNYFCLKLPLSTVQWDTSSNAHSSNTYFLLQTVRGVVHVSKVQCPIYVNHWNSKLIVRQFSTLLWVSDFFYFFIICLTVKSNTCHTSLVITWILFLLHAESVLQGGRGRLGRMMGRRPPRWSLPWLYK